MKTFNDTDTMGDDPYMTAARTLAEVGEISEIEERRSSTPLQVHKPPSQAVTLRLPDALIEQLKHMARQRDVSFQTLVKVLLSEKLADEILNR